MGIHTLFLYLSSSVELIGQVGSFLAMMNWFFGWEKKKKPPPPLPPPNVNWVTILYVFYNIWHRPNNRSRIKYISFHFVKQSISIQNWAISMQVFSFVSFHFAYLQFVSRPCELFHCKEQKKTIVLRMHTFSHINWMPFFLFKWKKKMGGSIAEKRKNANFYLIFRRMRSHLHRMSFEIDLQWKYAETKTEKNINQLWLNRACFFHHFVRFHFTRNRWLKGTYSENKGAK